MVMLILNVFNNSAFHVLGVLWAGFVVYFGFLHLCLSARAALC